MELGRQGKPEIPYYQYVKIVFDSYSVFFYTKNKTMARQIISFSKPNDEWLKSQIENEEYSSKSELVNDLIRQAKKTAGFYRLDQGKSGKIRKRWVY